MQKWAVKGDNKQMLVKYWENILGEFSYKSLGINITTVVSIREVVLICPEKKLLPLIHLSIHLK